MTISSQSVTATISVPRAKATEHHIKNVDKMKSEEHFSIVIQNASSRREQAHHQGWQLHAVRKHFTGSYWESAFKESESNQ